MTRTCTKCKKEKEDFKFCLDKNRPDGLNCWCKDCVSEYGKRRRRGHKLHYTFGITEGQYALILKSQDGTCAICGRPETMKRDGVIQPLSVDHCHQTQRVRGLLCSACNTGIGALKDDPELTQKATDYLLEYK